MCGSSGGGSNEVQETAQEVALSEVTQEEWNRYKDTYQPLMNKQADYYSGLGSGEKERIAGAVNAGVTKSFTNAENAVKANTLASGKTPESLAIGLGSVERDKASVAGTNMAKSATNVDRTKVAGLQNVVGLMRGDAGEAVSGMGAVAGNAVADANREAFSSQQSRNDAFETGATLAGAALSAYSGGASAKTKNPDLKNVGADVNYRYDPYQMPA